MIKITYSEFHNTLAGAKLLDAQMGWIHNVDYLFAVFAFDDSGCLYVEPECRRPAVDERLYIYQRHPGWHAQQARFYQ